MERIREPSAPHRAVNSAYGRDPAMERWREISVRDDDAINDEMTMTIRRFANARQSSPRSPSSSRLSVATARSFSASASARRTDPSSKPIAVNASTAAGVGGAAARKSPGPPRSNPPAPWRLPPRRARSSLVGSRDEHPRRAGSISAGIEPSERRREERADERRPPAPPRKRHARFRPSRCSSSSRRGSVSETVPDSRLYVQWEPRRAQEE